MDRSRPKGSAPLPMKGIRRPGGLPWMPWRWIRKRYPPSAWREMAMLFDAYHRLHLILDFGEIRSKIPPRTREDPCRRCGRCCAELLPEPVSADKIRSWVKSRNPAYMFHASITEGPRTGRFYVGWYFNNVRLRMCPLLFRDPSTGDKFCAVYHLGDGNRPPGCEGFRANWPHCEVSQRPLVP